MQVRFSFKQLRLIEQSIAHVPPAQLSQRKPGPQSSSLLQVPLGMQ
jgi:hypothetical protein